MFDGDGNLFALNRHLREQEMAEDAFEEFEAKIKKDIEHIEKIVEYLYYEANDYVYKRKIYDFTEQLQEMLEEVIK